MKQINRLISLGFIPFLSILAGCPGTSSSPDSGPPDAPHTGIVEIGTGTTAFESLANEDELTLWAGPQGGHHFIVHARIREMEPGDWRQPSLPGNPTTRFYAFDEQDTQVDLDLPPYALGYREEQGDKWQYLPSGRLLRTEESMVPAIDGQRVRLLVRVEDANGVIAVDERWIVAREFDPEDVDAGPGDPSVDAGVGR